MELLDRYLHAVRFWLPKAHQNDIIEELRDGFLAIKAILRLRKEKNHLPVQASQLL
jgi:hypothetical protein